jgi:hypothetical protein
MKTLLLKQHGARGSTLMLTLFVTAIVGFVLAAYLTLIRGQNQNVSRSQAWNATVAVIEAGVEDALTHLNRHGSTNLFCDGWQFINGEYVMQRTVGENYYVVAITNFVAGTNSNNSPSINSQGYVQMPVVVASAQNAFFAAAGVTESGGRTYLARGVRATTRKDFIFAKGMVARDTINLKGNNIASDSFDSSDPNYSTNGLYDPTKTRDNGDIATNSSLTNSVNVGNADIMGHVSTGPNGSVDIGPNGAVGSKDWVNTHNKGIESGWRTDDMNVDFPDVQVPFSGGAFTPGNGLIGTTNCTYLLVAGNYQLDRLTLDSDKKLYVAGNAVLYVTGDVSITGNANIEIATGASLQLYVGGTSANLGGNGVINNAGNATNFYYKGLPGNTSLSIVGNGTFTGLIYAPNAELSLSGSGNNTTDFVGASVSNTSVMNGHYNFHYDEALKKYGPARGYIVNGWNEINPDNLKTYNFSTAYP